MQNKTVLLGVTGGIAAYKACSLASMLVKLGASVQVVMTKNAAEFVSPLTFETLTHNRVVIEMFDRNFKWDVEHISIAKKADLAIIAPATANFVGKIANGIADDFLTTTVMALTCPLFVAPAMNTNMLNSAAYKKNAAVLCERGVKFIQSVYGRLACGDEGEGRMAEPEQIVDFVVDYFAHKSDYKNKTVLISAGATREPIDPVRFITNRSSGKMGCALASAAIKRGARVILVAGNMSVAPPCECELVSVETTQQMHDAVMNNLAQSDVVIMAAAPSDYKAEKIASKKIKEQDLQLSLSKNPDIARAVGKVKGNKTLVIFCAETDNLSENALFKLTDKNADMAVANDVTKAGAGFDVDTNIVSIFSKKGSEALPIMKKTDLADEILSRILSVRD